MRSLRRCTRNGCPKTAVATLTYVYADSTAVVGPLALVAEPHSYDLCQDHALGLTAPRGWDLVRHQGEFGPPPPPPADDLVALAEAVREAGRPVVHLDETDPRSSAQPARAGRRGHLRVLPPLPRQPRRS